MNEKRGQLTDKEIEARLGSLSGWKVVSGKLHREYQFRDFVEAWGFMTQAAILAQQMDHHPEWSNVYNRVTVDLVTHSAGGITPMDLDLAGKMEELAGRLKP